MNIFFLDKNPAKAAGMLCDKHVVRMTLETAQMLCTVAHRHGSDPAQIPYKPTHKNHPCTLWAGDSFNNWIWLINHGYAIAKEYTKRYGKVHKSFNVIEWCADFSNTPLQHNNTKPPLCMPDAFKMNNHVDAYRAYYESKASFASWTHPGAVPYWWPFKMKKLYRNGHLVHKTIV